MPIPGLSFTSQKTSVSSQQSQNLAFNPQISIQSPGSTLTPTTSTPTSQSSSQGQEDRFTIPLISGGGTGGLESLLGLTGQNVPQSTPNDTSVLGGGTNNAGIFEGNFLILAAVGIGILILFGGKGGK